MHKVIMTTKYWLRWSTSQTALSAGTMFATLYLLRRSQAKHKRRDLVVIAHQGQVQVLTAIQSRKNRQTRHRRAALGSQIATVSS